MKPEWLNAVRFNADGLVSVTAIDAESRQILMQAWANAEALLRTIETGEMVYYSRSRQKLWHKGEESGHTQKWEGIWLDCDGDAIIASVRQAGGIACHTGRQSCFYRLWQNGQWIEDQRQPILKSEQEIYDRH